MAAIEFDPRKPDKAENLRRLQQIWEQGGDLPQEEIERRLRELVQEPEDAVSRIRQRVEKQVGLRIPLDRETAPEDLAA